MTAITQTRRNPCGPSGGCATCSSRHSAAGCCRCCGRVNSLRDYDYTATHGYFSFGGFTFSNYTDAWARAEFGEKFLNSVYITVPAVLLTLFLSSCIAFVLARFSFALNLTLLGFFVAANLLPPQALLIRLQGVQRDPGTDCLNSDARCESIWGESVNTASRRFLHLGEQLIKTCRTNLDRRICGARVIGSSQLTLPLCVRPGRVGTLQVTWIYHEFFWATSPLTDVTSFPHRSLTPARARHD